MSESSISYQPLGTERYKKIVFLTGAGISKASGLPTYRGKGGVWTTENVEDIEQLSKVLSSGFSSKGFRTRTEERVYREYISDE